MRVKCEIGATELPGDYLPVAGVCAICSRCGHSTESYGTSDSSIRRCLVVMREECPRGENNFYVDENDE